MSRINASTVGGYVPENSSVVTDNVSTGRNEGLHFNYGSNLAYRIVSWMNEHISPSLLFVAVIGNLVAFAVFSMPSYRHSLTSMLYRVLAVADTMAVVIYDGFGTLARIISGENLIVYNAVTCKFFVPLHVWSRAFSAWVLVIIGLERVIGILRPHRAKAINTKRRYGWIITGTALALLCFYAPLFLGIRRIPVYNEGVEIGGYCAFYYYRNHLKEYFMIFDWANLMLTSLLPFAIIISFNVAIIIALRKRIRRVSEYHGNQSDKNNAVAILISVSLTFIILTLPYALYILLQKYYSSVGKYNLFERTSIVLGTLAPICDSLNHSINIALYCFCGRKFRQCLLQMICYACRKRRPGVNGHVASAKISHQDTSISVITGESTEVDKGVVILSVTNYGHDYGFAWIQIAVIYEKYERGKNAPKQYSKHVQNWTRLHRPPHLQSQVRRECYPCDHTQRWGHCFTEPQ